MSTAVIKGDNTILWGATGVYSGTGAGYVTSGSDQLTGEKLEVKDKDGFTVAVVFFDDKHNVQFEAVIKAAAPALARGDAATVCGIAYCLIDEVEILWENAQARKYRVKGTNYTAISSTP
jgi:hypothetical protein